MAKKDKNDNKKVPPQDDKTKKSKVGGCLPTTMLGFLLLLIFVSFIVTKTRKDDKPNQNNRSGTSQNEGNMTGLINSKTTVVQPPTKGPQTKTLVLSTKEWSHKEDVAYFNDIQCKALKSFEMLANGGTADEARYYHDKGQWWQEKKGKVTSWNGGSTDWLKLQLKSTSEERLEATITMTPK